MGAASNDSRYGDSFEKFRLEDCYASWSWTDILYASSNMSSNRNTQVGASYSNGIVSVPADSSTSSSSLQHLEALMHCIENTAGPSFIINRIHSSATALTSSAVRGGPSILAIREVRTTSDRGPSGSFRNRGAPRTGLRRQMANARERQRMHNLNGALDNLRRHVPLVSETQKLSKIETIRMARNYICLLSSILKEDDHERSPGTDEITMPDASETAAVLSRGMSQPTSNAIRSILGVDHQRVQQHFRQPEPDGSNPPQNSPSAAGLYRLNDLLSSAYQIQRNDNLPGQHLHLHLWNATSNGSWMTTASDDEDTETLDSWNNHAAHHYEDHNNAY